MTKNYAYETMDMLEFRCREDLKDPHAIDLNWLNGGRKQRIEDTI